MKAILELCINHAVCIYNGLVVSNMGIWKQSTTDGSVIDYVIGSPFLLSKSTDVVVHDFDGILSDKHSLVIWEMQSKCNTNNLKLQDQALDDKKAIGRII